MYKHLLADSKPQVLVIIQATYHEVILKVPGSSLYPTLTAYPCFLGSFSDLFTFKFESLASQAEDD